MDEIIVQNHPMDADLAPYHLPDPYPVPVNLKPDSRRGAILSLAYAGKNSEMTALTQYVVHHETYGKEYAQVSRDILNIGIIEMHHLDMLGACMRQLGVPLELKSYSGFGATYWNARNIVYGRTPRERILIDIQGEKDCVKQYKNIISYINSPAIENLLLRIEADEEHHIKLLEKMLENFLS
ncbi:MAG: hypothetical protein LBM16_05545 [Clostridiales bacterium]|jgi:bacterioferritin|nr:hypothetical protein [Clostridiales bacterium]